MPKKKPEKPASASNRSMNVSAEKSATNKREEDQHSEPSDHTIGGKTYDPDEAWEGALERGIRRGTQLLAIDWATGFIDRFDEQGRKFAVLRGMEKQPDGSLTFPWHEYTPDVEEFVKGLYEKGLVVQFDWPRWKLGEKLFVKPRLIQTATESDCLKLLTLCVRKEKFSDGFLAQALENGIVTACLKRLRDLRRLQHQPE
jgi:hypothetical protein